jgi:hypothetical protein
LSLFSNLSTAMNPLFHKGASALRQSARTVRHKSSGWFGEEEAVPFNREQHIAHQKLMQDLLKKSPDDRLA